jgi:hypothetical protein
MSFRALQKAHGSLRSFRNSLIANYPPSLIAMALNQSTIDPMDSAQTYIPWTWTIRSLDPQNYPCQLPRSSILAHAITVMVSGILGMGVGHKNFPRQLSHLLSWIIRYKHISRYLRSKRGKRSGHERCKKAFRCVSRCCWWVVPLGIHLIACWVIATFIRHEGYQSDYKTGQYMLFLFQLPRG